MNKQTAKIESLISQKKELWQMTMAEYEYAHGQLRVNTTVTGGFSPHKNAVEVAVNKGHPVPQEVLADYPSIARELQRLGHAF